MLLWYSDAKVTLKNVYCVFVAYFVVFTWARSTRSSSEAGKALWFFFRLLFSLGLRMEVIGKPRSKFCEIFLHFLKSCTWNYFGSLARALNVFKLCRETQTAWRYNRVHILSSKHTYRPMRARLLSQIIYNTQQKNCGEKERQLNYVANKQTWKL